MKTQLNQLERLYDRLSPKERAILSLQRWKAGEAPDEALKGSTPQHDVKMVWKYLDAARDTGTIIGGQTAWLEAKLEAIEARLGILALFRVWEMHADCLRLDLYFVDAVTEKLQSDLEQHPGGGNAERLTALQDHVVRSVETGLGQAEATRLALEEVVAWAAEDFDGEEPIHPGLRADLDAVAERIRELAAQLVVYGSEVEMPTESDAEMVETLKRAIAN